MAAADGDSKPLDYIQEVILKKRKNNEQWALRRREQLEQKKWKAKEDKKNAFKRAEHFIDEHRKREVDFITMKHRAKRRKTSLAPEAKLLFVIRIQGTNDTHPKTKKILGLLGLSRIYSGVFVKPSEGIMQMLLKVEAYIAYGYPNLSNIRELIFKKGLAKVDKQRVPLTDNNMIEKALGKHGIICIEDIVNEIANVGPHFKDVTSFLWPFSLNKPEEQVRWTKQPFKNGGDAGNREDHINELIKKMN